MSPALVQSAHFNANCLDLMLAKPRLSFDWLRFDSNDDCNLRRVYCHNSRSKQVIDTLDESVFSDLRGGAKIGKILRNIKRLSEVYSQVRIKFVVTVATSNLPHTEALATFGGDIGISSAIVRKMFHPPGSNRVDDAKMTQLALPNGVFDALSARLKARFDGQVHLNCIDAKGIKTHNAPVQAHSYRQTETG